jgi:hypothetical protein
LFGCRDQLLEFLEFCACVFQLAPVFDAHG